MTTDSKADTKLTTPSDKKAHAIEINKKSIRENVFLRKKLTTGNNVLIIR